jgi:hypothetical protein
VRKNRYVEIKVVDGSGLLDILRAQQQLPIQQQLPHLTPQVILARYAGSGVRLRQMLYPSKIMVNSIDELELST